MKGAYARDILWYGPERAEGRVSKVRMHQVEGACLLPQFGAGSLTFQDEFQSLPQTFIADNPHAVPALIAGRFRAAPGHEKCHIMAAPNQTPRQFPRHNARAAR